MVRVCSNVYRAVILVIENLEYLSRKIYYFKLMSPKMYLLSNCLYFNFCDITSLVFGVTLDEEWPVSSVS